MSKEKLPTAKHFYLISNEEVFTVMDQYKDLHTAPLQARIEDLEKENERLTKLAEKRKRQLDAACADSKYFNDECDRLSEALEGLIPLAEDGYCHHKLNGCHEDTLEEDRGNLKIAKEALKGGSDE